MAVIFKGAPPEMLKAFAADRAPFTASMKRLTAADATVNLAAYLGSLDAQLADGRPYLLGVEASIADFAVAHCGWYLRRAGTLAEIVTRHVHFNAWLDRMLAIGHGSSEPLSSEQALAIAKTATTHAPTTVQAGLGFDAGQAVTVTPTDYGMDAVAGTLVGLSADEVVLARDDERAGRVHVHFPRRGFQIKPETT
jgi:hypothetical protein